MFQYTYDICVKKNIQEKRLERWSYRKEPLMSGGKRKSIQCHLSGELRDDQGYLNLNINTNIVNILRDDSEIWLIIWIWIWMSSSRAWLMGHKNWFLLAWPGYIMAASLRRILPLSTVHLLSMLSVIITGLCTITTFSFYFIVKHFGKQIVCFHTIKW